MKNNPYASVVDEVPNVEEDLTTYASKINEEDDDMSISYQEKKNTVGYQENLKIDVKNINKHIKTTCRPIYEVIDATFFEETDIFPQAFSD